MSVGRSGGLGPLRVVSRDGSGFSMRGIVVVVVVVEKESAEDERWKQDDE